MSEQLEEALVEALDLLEQGTPVVKILSRYPELAGQLRPYLLTALDLNHLAKSSSNAAREASKREFLEFAAVMQVKQRKSTAARLREILVSGLAVLFILFFAGAVMAVSANESIPGDALYDTKLFMEQIRLNYSANSEAAAALIKTLQHERVDEVNKLLSLGRQENVIFSGVVEQLAEGRWIVEGIPVEITSSTIIHDEVEVGFVVQVKGTTSSNVVLAEQIEVLAERPPDSDLTDPPQQEDPSAIPLPTLEPLTIPERPELVLPEDSSVLPLLPDPVSTSTPEDDLNGEDGTGYEEDGDQLESQPPEDDDGQKERDENADESSNRENDDSDERGNEVDQNDDSSEESASDEEDKVEKDSDFDDDPDEKDKQGGGEGDEFNEAEKGKNNPANPDDPDNND